MMAYFTEFVHFKLTSKMPCNLIVSRSVTVPYYTLHCKNTIPKSDSSCQYRLHVLFHLTVFSKNLTLHN